MGMPRLVAHLAMTMFRQVENQVMTVLWWAGWPCRAGLVRRAWWVMRGAWRGRETRRVMRRACLVPTRWLYAWLMARVMPSRPRCPRQQGIRQQGIRQQGHPVVIPAACPFRAACP